MNIKKGKILVVGSVVIDIILEDEFFGGTGANIAYGLGKFKSSPILFSLVGHDFKHYFGPHLKQNGVDLRVHVDKKNKTANFICVPHKKGHKGEIWAPNAYRKIHNVSLAKKISPKDFKKISIAIFSAGTPLSTYRHLREFRKFAPSKLVIFDPGQMTKVYSKEQIIKCFELADILVVNNLEYRQMKATLGQDPVLFFKHLNKVIIKTMGAKGSVILQGSRIVKIPAVKPKRVLDLTGAGDAYRAGLLFGLWKGLSLPKACALGARLASKNIEHMGCQKY